MRRILLFIFSTQHLKLSQLLYFMYYRFWGFNKVDKPKLPSDFKSELKCTRLKQSRSEQKNIIDINQRTICFLNQLHEFDLANFDWSPEQRSRLWRYHLHYFDYLFQTDLPDLEKAHLISDWIKKNDQGLEPAWEPYTASLRIVNWVIYLSERDVPAEWKRSLYLQTRWLYANLERHILANHYFENLKAILFSALYFSSLTGPMSKEVMRWKSFALTYLKRELVEQFLADGGHYERSPQYHNIMIKNCLELLDLLISCEQESLPICTILRQTVRKGLAFSYRIMRPDGKIPLFNDSSFDQTPDTQLLLNQERQLGGIFPQDAKTTSVVAEKQSGIYGVKTEKDWLMIDCGDIGPAYQPGHTHCDFLSYELVLENTPLIVNSGVYEYDNSSLRQRLRSTRSHNTVSVLGLDQSQIWSSFRVAKRAKKVSARIWQEHNNVIFEGAYTGFNQWRFSAKHSRRIEIGLSNDNAAIHNIRVDDTIAVKSARAAAFTSYIHLHPDLKVEPQDKFRYLLCLNGRILAVLNIHNAEDVDLEQGIYSPEFGMLHNRITFALQSLNGLVSYELLRIFDKEKYLSHSPVSN